MSDSSRPGADPQEPIPPTVGDTPPPAPDYKRRAEAAEAEILRLHERITERETRLASYPQRAATLEALERWAEAASGVASVALLRLGDKRWSCSLADADGFTAHFTAEETAADAICSALAAFQKRLEQL